MPERLIESLRCVGDDGRNYTLDVYEELLFDGAPGPKYLALRGSWSAVLQIYEGTYHVLEDGLILRVTRH